MALNYTVTYKKSAASRLSPTIAIDVRPYMDTPLRFTLDLRGIDGVFTHEDRYGAVVRVVEGIMEIDGTATAINTILSTMKYAAAPEGGSNPVAIECVLYRKSGDLLENMDNGVINFVAIGFGPDEHLPPQPFSPVWVTPSGRLFTANEGSVVSQSVQAVMTTQMLGKDVTALGPLKLVQVPQEYDVSGVLINGAPAVFDRDGDALWIVTPFRLEDLVEIRLNLLMAFSINYGTLPPGLSLGPSGSITGRVGTLPNAKNGVIQSFTLGLRVSTPDGTYRDRRFIIDINPVASSVSDPAFIDLPPGDGIKNIGVYARGAPISYVVETTAPNGLSGILEESVSDATADDTFSGLPEGVTIQPSGVISGTISPATAIGEHHFAVTLKNARGEVVAVRRFSLTVNSPTGALEPLRFVRWETMGGTLGSFMEGEVCPVGVKAYSTTGEPVVYRVLPETPLPVGIRMDAASGDLMGVFNNVPEQREVIFTVRASVGESFVDREFSLTVTPRYRSKGSINVGLKLRRAEAVPMAESYGPLIPENEYFRPNDSNFGDLREPTIYLIGGLKRSDHVVNDPSPCAPPPIPNTMGPEDAVIAAIKSSKIQGPVTLRLGDHKLATVRVGGAVVYEVLYREVIDPLHRAGGFVVDHTGIPTRECIYHPQSGTPINPESINNIRCELALQIGFDAFNVADNNKIGIGGPENLPQWMSRPQSANRSNSATGFVPAMVIAYLKPGAGQRVLDKIISRRLDAPHPMDDANPLLPFHETTFNQFYLSFDDITVSTTFDGGMTTFDDSLTIFDEYAIRSGKYQRMNPKIGIQ